MKKELLSPYALLNSFLFLIIIILTDTLNIFPQQCGECIHPRVALYDSNVQLPFPSTADSIIKWYSLFWPSAVANATFTNSDASKGCMTFYDGAMINATTLQGNTLKFGAGYANLPASGEIESVDYLIESSVTGSGSSYTFTLKLEASISREVVKSVSINFTPDLASEQNAGTTAASSFIPLFNTINEFEVNKRNTDQTVAIKNLWDKNSAEVIKVEPKKTTANAGDSVDVDITLIDCDGVPLKNRTLYLKEITVNGNLFEGSVNGSFLQDHIVTDDQGKATVKFVPSSPGLSVLNVNFPHKKPNGRDAGFTGTAYINVPVETVHINVIWNFTHSSTGDYDTTITDGTNSENEFGHLRVYDDQHFRVNGLVERDYTVTDYKLFNHILYMTVSGSGSGSSSTREQIRITTPDVDEIFSIDLDQHTINTKAVNPVTDCSIQFPVEDDPYIEAGLIFNIAGHDKGSTQTYRVNEGWKSSDFDYIIDNSNGPIFGQPQSETEYIETIGSTFIFNHYYEEIRDYNGYPNFNPLATIHDRWVLDWNVILYPYHGPTGIKDNNKIPKGYRLEQNYPNPFNPSTTISFSLFKSGNVTLKLYDILGREAAVLVNGYKNQGTYKVTLDASKLISGVYFYRMQAGSFIDTKKMILLK